jgi:hypothetical protein
VLLEAEPAWKGATDARCRANFLLGYACELASFIRHFDLLRGSAATKKPEFSSVPSLSFASPDRVSPELLSAFPDEGTGGWVMVEAMFTGYSEKPEEPEKGRLRIDGEHNVQFFIWLPAARRHLERLEAGPWRARLGGLAKEYPFKLRDRVASAPSNHRVLVVGRFLRDRLGFPRNWFEVWDIKVGLSREQEEILRAVAEPLEISLANVTMARVARYLHDWLNLEVEFDQVESETPVSCYALGSPVAVFLNQAAQALKADWYYDNHRVVFSSGAPESARKDVEAVLEYLAEVHKDKPQPAAVTRLK